MTDSEVEIVLQVEFVMTEMGQEITSQRVLAMNDRERGRLHRKRSAR
jgi:hypothetical protein